MSTSFLDHLADYADGIRYERIPQNVVEQAILTIADTVACVMSGSRHPDALAVLASELARGGSGEVSVMGTESRLSVEGAARVNGYMGDIYELNDLTCGHSGIGNVVASLAMAEFSRANGRELLEALVTGIEVTSRIYSAYYPTMKPYTDVGIVPVGPAGSAGTAAACAKLLKLDRRGILNAMANSMAQAGWCPAEVIFGDGGTIKPLLFGSMPASSGIVGAIYAQHGISGPREILEGGMGYLKTVSKTYSAAPFLDTDTWYLGAPRRKLHACCGYIHSAIDTLVALRKGGLDPATVAKVRVGMPAYIIAAVSKTHPPRTANEARFHSQYCMALALWGEDVILPEHSENMSDFISRPDIQRLVAAIEVVQDDALSHYHESNVEVLAADGRALDKRFNGAPRGSSQNPLSKADIWEKFERLSGVPGSGISLDAYRAQLERLAEAPGIEWIIRI